MVPPPRNLDGLTLRDEPALTRLVPGFGSAWSRLSATVTLREQMVAHEADLALIYAPGRDVDVMPAVDDSRYGLFVRSNAQAK